VKDPIGGKIMNLSAISNTEIGIFIALAIFATAAIVIWSLIGKRRTKRLRNQFGGAEYTRAVEEVGDKRRAEAVLDGRADRVEDMHIKPLTEGDRARFVESWSKVQARFVDSPEGAVKEADQLLGGVMSTRGYPASDFEQRAADISVDHPLVLENYRAAHQIAVRQAQGQATTEDLRQAMIHYRSLFDELVREPELANAKGA
jgi:hypothetical protein